MWAVLGVVVGVAARESFDLTLVPDDGSVEKEQHSQRTLKSLYVHPGAFIRLRPIRFLAT